MNVLWITNIMMPDVCIAQGQKPSVYGGWLSGSAKYLVESKAVNLAIASVYGGDNLWHQCINRINYYLLPLKTKRVDYNSDLEHYWKQVRDEVKPDIVHVHGSEFPFGLAYVNACGGNRVVVSIQGMTSVYANHYYADLNTSTILYNITFKDIVRRQSIFNGHKDYVKRGEIEIDLIEKVHHVIGRTTWDRMHTQCINKDIVYHFCNETLRNSFYSGKWSYNKCVKHSIFVPQAFYPIKGLHKVIESLSIVKERYPDVTLRIAGSNIIQHQTLKEKLALSGYGKIVLGMINKFNLFNHVTFTGLLDEVQMKQEYLNANVFVCPSSIENSPNSLGEAQLLGTPSIGAFVGGVPDMIEHGRTGFVYRFEDTDMLASYICEVFDMEDSIQIISDNEIEAATKRHDGEANNSGLLNIYKEIVYADK